MIEQLIVNSFDQTNVPLIFGYGSKVIKQAGGSNSSDLFDIIMVVDNTREWHRKNLTNNNHHYSLVKHLPNSCDKITKIQEQYGAKLYFNPYVKLGNYSFKYGVIQTDHLIEDLSHWSSLYCAGRLHKPVQLIVDRIDTNESLKVALKFNRDSAIRAALLQLPETFNSVQLYKTITGLSYGGDFRMLFGEDVNKVENIVMGQLDKFDQMYLPLLKFQSTFKDSIYWNENKQVFSQDLSSKSLLKHLKLLPREVRKSICLLHGKQARTIEMETVLNSASKSINCDKLVSQALVTIVRRSSLTQSLKGLLTAGFVKSIKYSQRKLIKSVVSRLKWY